MKKPILYLCTFIFYTAINITHAGGPISISGSNGTTAVVYADPNITLHVETGKLGTLTNAEAVTLIRDALSIWNEVSTSTINLSIDQTLITVDIDETNVETFLPSVNGSVLNEADNRNPIVFDDDGEIIDLYFGVGQKTNVLGFADSIINTETGKYIEGFAVINGVAPGTDEDIKLTIAHEFGHFFGLDHSQINIENNESFSGLPPLCFTTLSTNYPLMYPFACRRTDTLHSDDASSITAQYPATNVNESYGTLTGIFVDESGSPILGANIWAENTTSGDTFSIVSDYLKQGNGAYKLLLPAGTYSLHANSVNPEFTAGSGVGPYSTSSTDLSFTDPHPIAEVSFHGSSEADDELITIAAGQSLSVSFSSIGARVATPGDSSGGSDNDSIADLFGSISQLMLTLFAGLVLVLRRLK